MYRVVHLINIQHYRTKLAEASDPSERELIETLLEREEAELLAAVRQKTFTIEIRQ